jgi:hypothetical protein
MAKATSTIATAEHKIEGFVEDLGKLLGHARTKAEGWMGQRRAIVKNLTELRDEASKLLGELGHGAVIAGRRGRKTVVAAVDGINGRKTRRKMSAKARAAISAGAEEAREAEG